MWARVWLVTMPWASPIYPSIQLGTLKPLLRDVGLAVEVKHYNLRFFEHAAEHGVSFARGLELAELGTLDDWVFAVPPFCARDEAADAELLARWQRDAPDAAAAARRCRALAPDFLASCADEIVRAAPRVVGLTSSFGQNVASLALAKLVKERRPEIAIVLGGANCDGPMGAAVHRLFPWIDVVVRGEAERVVAPLFDDLVAGRPVRDLPGICVRRDGESVALPPSHDLVAMSQVPTPDYDEYFAAVEASPLRADLLPLVRILYESARGCWWGEKNHCTFCGLNGTAMAFRSKAADRAFDELVALARRYRSTRFQVVDNIIELRYLSELLPRLRTTAWDWDLFYETKANLKADQLRMFRESGVKRIQPGIESLSTSILRLMRKGVTALQNIRLLKWCAELGIGVTWNLIYGFPGEDPDEYRTMADIIPSLVHLEPPNALPLTLDRFSPYLQDPAGHGIEIVGPADAGNVYPVERGDLLELGYQFAFRYVDGREPADYARPVLDAIRAWRARPEPGALTYRIGPGFVHVDDRRSTIATAQYTFDEHEALIFIACDAGATPAQVHRMLSERGVDEFSQDEIRGFLDQLVELRIVYRERDRYVGLATASDPLRAVMSTTTSSDVDESPLVRIRTAG